MTQAALADALGYSAAALVLWTFSLNSMRALRVVAIASNLMFIAYGAAAQLWPVLLLHAILLPLNGWRLWQLGRAASPAPPASPPLTAAGAARPCTAAPANRQRPRAS